MALPRPGTLDLATFRDVMKRDFFVPLISRMVLLIHERLPSYVHYAGGKCTYITPDKFFWPQSAPGPSDCDWIVPGPHF